MRLSPSFQKHSVLLIAKRLLAHRDAPRVVGFVIAVMAILAVLFFVFEWRIALMLFFVGLLAYAYDLLKGYYQGSTYGKSRYTHERKRHF